MKCTNPHDLLKEIRNKVLGELAVAIMAHGGSYQFINTELYDDDGCDEDGEYWTDSIGYDVPIVEALASCNGEVYDSFYVTEVSVNAEGKVNIYGVLTEDGEIDDERRLEEISISQLSYITDLIPPTDEVTDVTGKSL